MHPIKIFRVISFLAIAAFASCKAPSNDNFEIIDEKYNIGWIGEEWNRSLCYHPEGKKGGLEIINPFVAAYGQNDQFIVALQHPMDCEGADCLPDTTVSYYFIIRKNMEEFNRKEDMWGPLTRERYEMAIANLGVGEVVLHKAS